MTGPAFLEQNLFLEQTSVLERIQCAWSTSNVPVAVLECIDVEGLERVQRAVGAH
jgi:hypothetical protein